MNTSGLNVTGLTVNTVGKVGEEIALPLAADGGLPEEFARALMSQVVSLSELNNPMAAAQSGLENPVDGVELPVISVEGQMPAATVGQDLPVSYKIRQTPEAITPFDTEAHVSTVTESINYVLGRDQFYNATDTQQAIEKSRFDKPGIAAIEPKFGDNSNENTAQVTPVWNVGINPLNDVARVDLSGSVDETTSKVSIERMATPVDDQADAPENSSALAMAMATVMPTLHANEAVKIPEQKASSPAVAVNVNPELSGISPMSADAVLETHANESLSMPASGDQVSWQSHLETGLSMQNGEDDSSASLVSGEQIAGAKTVVVGVTNVDKTASVKEEMPGLSRPLNHPDWDEEVGSRILWMHNRNLSAAEIKMNPQHLGPVTVRIEMDKDQASIVFNAEHAVVREALESSIPKLREMMSMQNLNLADVNIAHQSSHQNQSQQGFSQDSNVPQKNNPANVAETESALPEEDLHAAQQSSNGLLSLYA